MHPGIEFKLYSNGQNSQCGVQKHEQMMEGGKRSSVLAGMACGSGTDQQDHFWTNSGTSVLESHIQRDSEDAGSHLVMDYGDYGCRSN